MESITLKCFICPKNPTFSDVSHLLTHISSKGHLSHQFKLKVRSQQEPEIEEQLANYDHWYNHFELGRLLSERMILKDSKKTGTRSRPRKSDTARGRSKGAKNAASSLTSTRENPDDVLDPRLTQTQFDGQKLPLPTSSLHGWPTAPEHGLNASNLTFRSAYHDADETESDGGSVHASHTRLMYPDPLKISSSSEVARPQAKDTFSDSTLDLTCLTRASQGGDELDGVDTEDTTSLKGVMWPGMGLFDSASDEMKRKRNQRKDGTILEQMEITSATVEPSEIIFSPSGVLKKRRYISGMPEISSPLKGETPMVKKRTNKTKQKILGEANPNVAVGGRRRGRKASSGDFDDHKLQELSRLTLPFMESSSPVRKVKKSKRSKLTEDEDAEFRLTVGDVNEKQSRGLKVFEDGNDRHQAAGCNVSSARLGPLSQPMSSYGRLLPAQVQAYPSLIDSHGQMRHRSHGMSMAAPAAASNHRRPSNQPSVSFDIGQGKENVESMLSHPLRLEPPAFSGERIRQRYFSTEEGQQPHFYSAVHPHMEFGAFAGSSVFGYSPNPLSFPFQTPSNQPDASHHFQRESNVQATEREIKNGGPGGSIQVNSTSPTYGAGLMKTEYDAYYLGEMDH